MNSFQGMMRIKTSGSMRQDEARLRISLRVPADYFLVARIRQRAWPDNMEGDEQPLFMCDAHLFFWQESRDRRIKSRTLRRPDMVTLEPDKSSAANLFP